MQEYLTNANGRKKLTLIWYVTSVYTVYTLTEQFTVQTCDDQADQRDKSGLNTGATLPALDGNYVIKIK
jgi:hypothetical protein